MAKTLYGSINGVSDEVVKIYAPVNGVSANVTKGYCSVGGVSKLFFGNGDVNNTGFWFYYSTIAGKIIEYRAVATLPPLGTDVVNKNNAGIAFYFISIDDNGACIITVSTYSNTIGYTDTNQGQTFNPTTGSISINGETWWYAYRDLRPNASATDITPNCSLINSSFSSKTAPQIADWMIRNRIYTDDFAEDYQVGQTYNLVKAGMEKTIRKFLALYLYKMVQWRTSDYVIPYNTICSNIENIVSFFIQSSGNNDIIDLWADYNSANNGLRLGAYYSNDSTDGILVESIDADDGYTTIQTDAYIHYSSCVYIDFNSNGTAIYYAPTWTTDDYLYIGKGGYGWDYVHLSNVGLNFKGGKPSSSNNWIPKAWNGSFGEYGLLDFEGNNIWTDGTNIYYSYYFSSSINDQKVLDKATNTWVTKTWNGYNNLLAFYIWEYEGNIYYSDGWRYQYVLDTSTDTWVTKTWTGPISQYFGISGGDIWTDGDNIYCSTNTYQYVLNKGTNTWSNKTWNGLAKFEGRYIWSDGTNIYYSDYNNRQYVLDKSTSTWSVKTWNGIGENVTINGMDIWKYGNNIYHSGSSNNSNFVLDKSTSTWNVKTWTGLTNPEGIYIWTDGNHIYHSDYTRHYVLNKI